MSIVTVDKLVLTKEHIAFIRKAEGLVVRADHCENFKGGYGTLQFRHGPTDAEVKMDLDCYANVRCYGGEGGIQSSEKTKAFCSVSMRYHDSAAYILKTILKAGDTVWVQFYADNNSETIRAAALHSDQCFLVIERNGKSIGKVMLDTSICPDNTARMVQRDYR